jgi:hypothetical protein
VFVSEEIRGPGATGAEALFTIPRLRGPEGPLYTVVWAAVCSPGSALHGCAGGSLLHMLSTEEWARACVPQPLKPLIPWAVHRSAEALRHPKAASPKSCATQKLRHPKAAPPKGFATQRRMVCKTLGGGCPSSRPFCGRSPFGFLLDSAWSFDKNRAGSGDRRIL